LSKPDAGGNPESMTYPAGLAATRAPASWRQAGGSHDDIAHPSSGNLV